MVNKTRNASISIPTRPVYVTGLKKVTSHGPALFPRQTSLGAYCLPITRFGNTLGPHLDDIGGDLTIIPHQ